LTDKPLFHFYLGTGFFKLGNEFLCFFLGNTFLDGFGCFIDKRLGVFETESRNCPDFLDNRYFFITCSYQDNIKFGLFLFLRTGACVTGAHCHHGYRSGG
jgi:hypothetical protein